MTSPLDRLTIENASIPGGGEMGARLRAFEFRLADTRRDTALRRP